MIMGETGIGKTRLAEELSQMAHSLGWRVAWTRAYEQEGTIPYRPWTDILRTLLQDIPMEQLVRMVEGKDGLLDNATPGALNPAATTQARLNRLSSLLPELATAQELHLQQTRPQTPIAPEQERFHLWEAMLSLLNALALATPLLLVLDDLHWTDDSSLELLAYLARHQQNERIMLVGTCRDIELGPSSSLRSLLNDLRREQVLVTFPLQSLTQAQIARLIAHLPHELVRRIQSQAGGNPLFAEELARFSETATSAPPRKYSQSSPHYAGQPIEPAVGVGSENDTSPMPLPETIAAVLERRLNKLGEACQTLLSKAAVLGRSFEFSLLIRMTGEVGASEDATLDLLEEALRSGLLTEEVNGSRIVYHFWHPLIVSHLYERLSAARRAQLHRRAAQALIELYADNEAKGAAAIAHHLGKYGQDKQRLAHYAEIAGNQAMALSAYPETLHYYRLALEALQALNTNPHLEQDPLHIANLLECMAECNYMLGNTAEARQQYARALELHQSQHKEASQFPNYEAFLAWQREEAQVQSIIWRSIGRVWKYIGEFGQAHDCAQQGKQVLLTAGIMTGAAWACLQHLDGSTCWAEGNFSEARRYMEESLKIHEEMMSKRQENADGEQAWQAYRHNIPVPLVTHSRRALLGDPLELGRTHESLGVIAASMAQYAEALQHLHTALAIFEKHDLVGAMSQVCSNIGAVHSMRSEYTIATTYFKRALELGERTGDRRSKLLVTGNLGDIAARNGDLQEAATWLAESLSLSEQASNREHTSWGLVTLATVQQDMGDMYGALENIRRALANARTIKSTTRVGFALVALANWRVMRALTLSQSEASSPQHNARVNLSNPACLRLLRAARAAIERALHLTGIDTETECTGQVVLTAIYYHLGELEQARRQALKALEETRLSEMVHLMGRAQQLLGEIQAASGLEKQADASFEEALLTFKEHGLRLDYARALYRYGSSLLARSLHVKSGHGPDAHAPLSPTHTASGYLREAREIFISCQAALDLQWVECTLTYPTLFYKEI
jgi:predicted ATPase